jgi:hypothetical protein
VSIERESEGQQKEKVCPYYLVHMLGLLVLGHFAVVLKQLLSLLR